MQIKKYSTEEAYSQDSTRLATASAVSYVDNHNKAHFDGVNILVAPKFAAVNDVAVWDTIASEVRFLKAGTIKRAQLPSNIKPFAAVYGKVGRKLMLVALENKGSEKWAYEYEAALSAIDTAAAGTVAFSIGALAVSVAYEAGATLASIASAIDTQLQAATVDNTKGWRAVEDATNSRIVLRHNYYNLSEITGVSGATLVKRTVDTDYQTNYAYLTATEQVERSNRVMSYRAGMNKAKFYQYYYSDGSTPTSDIALGSDTIVNAASFKESSHCAALRAAYCASASSPTDADYKAYLLGEHMLKNPGKRGAIARDGKSICAQVGNLDFVDIYGATKKRYPAMAAALAYKPEVLGDAETPFDAGAWWLPSVSEMLALMEDRAYDSSTVASDKLNSSIIAVSGAAMYGNGYYPWTSSEYGSYYAFLYTGGHGDVDSRSKCDAYAVRPVSAFEVED